MPRKGVKFLKNCQTCRYKCSQKISNTEREQIFQSFWRLTDQQKLHFYSEFTLKQEKARTRAIDLTRQRTFSYKYFLRCGQTSTKVRVCKEFFLGTLDISGRRISYFYDNLRSMDTGVPLPIKQGKYPKKKTSAIDLDHVREHINMFPRLGSHYCRNDTKREYLEASLTLSKMYELYGNWCKNEKHIIPLKKHKYVEIFNTEFNIGFRPPKKDRCDRCELESSSNEAYLQNEQHRENKLITRIERNKDRNLKNKPVICFDLENVFSLPKSGVSNFFYKRKLATFNMTAHFSLTKKSYFGIWHEGTGGRTGNNMACAIVQILEKVMLDHPNLKELTLWSDSCVPQNRNSIMSLALGEFMQRHPGIEWVIQKFCEPGHSSIQEVDSVHSVIERHLRNKSIYSPLGLVEELSTLRNSETILVKEQHFLDYQTKAKSKYCYDNVPYSKVRQILYGQALGSLSYKLSHDSTDWIYVSVRRNRPTRTDDFGDLTPPIISLRRLNPKPLSDLKKKDLKSMCPFMGDTDRRFIEKLCR